MRAPTNQSVQIRDYRSCDFDRLYQIDQLCFEPRIAYSRSELAYYVRDPRCTVKIAEISGVIAGYVIGKIEQDSLAHIVTLDVLPHARRQGIGTRLIETIHREFVKRHASISVLEVNAQDAGARSFWERLHYQYAGILPAYYDDRIDACRMFCLLRLPGD